MATIQDLFSGTTQGSSSTYFPQENLLPGYALPFTQQSSGLAQSTIPQYSQYVQNPTQSPLYQNALSGLLAALQPSEEAARTGVTDAFRNAGNLSSGAFANASAQLEGDLVRNRQVTASNLLNQQFPQMIQALLGPQQNFTNLLQALKLSQSFTPPQLDVGGGGGSGGSSSGSFLNSVTSPGGQSFATSSGGGGGGGSGSSFLRQPFANPGGEQMITHPNGIIAGLQGGGGSPGASTGGSGTDLFGNPLPNIAPLAPQPQGYSSGGFGDMGYFGGNGLATVGGQPYSQPTDMQYYGWNGDQGQPIDQWGYTQADWANDPYFN